MRKTCSTAWLKESVLLILLSILYLSPGAAPCAGSTPLFLDQETKASGLDDVDDVGSYSRKATEHRYSEKLPNGKTADFMVRLPEGASGGSAKKIRGIVFVAPAPDDEFSTAKSTLTKAFVGKLDCAVIGLSMSAPKDEYWVREKFYVYPESGYFEKIAELVARIRGSHGDDETPVFLIGKSAGGVMALYLAKDKKLNASGVIAFNLSQDSDIAPGLLDVNVPTLVLSAEDSQWNARISRLQAEAIERGNPVAFCIGRPVIYLDEDKPYRVNSAGRYGNELAYCFIRDALLSSESRTWPKDWRPNTVTIKVFGEEWSQSIYSSGEDYNRLYNLASHFIMEILPGGEQAYICESPLPRKRMVVMIKKGNWSRLDQARFASLLGRRGYGAIICSAPDSASAAAYLQRHLTKIKQLQVEATVMIMPSQTDARWESALTEVLCGIPFIVIRRAGADPSGNHVENPHVVRLEALGNYKKKDYESLLYAAPPIWMAPKAFDGLLVKQDLKSKEQATTK